MTNKIEKIKDYQFEFYKIPTKEALKLSGKVIKVLGPALGGIKKEEGNELAILSAFRDIDFALVEELFDSFCQYSSYLGKDGNYKLLKMQNNVEELFAGDVGFVYSFMWKFIELNFLSGLTLPKV